MSSKLWRHSSAARASFSGLLLPGKFEDWLPHLEFNDPACLKHPRAVREAFVLRKPTMRKVLPVAGQDDSASRALRFGAVSRGLVLGFRA